MKKSIIIFIIIVLALSGVIFGQLQIFEKDEYKYLTIDNTYFDDIKPKTLELVGDNLYFDNRILKLETEPNFEIYNNNLLSNFQLISDYLKTNYPEIKVYVDVFSINEESNGMNLFIKPVTNDVILVEDSLAGIMTIDGTVQESIVQNLDTFKDMCTIETPELMDLKELKEKAVQLFIENINKIKIPPIDYIIKEYYLSYSNGIYYYNFDVGPAYIMINAENGEILDTSF